MERKRVWKPLGMTHTAITLTPWMKQHLALGHDEKGDVTANWDLPTFAGAGAIRSTTDDMLKFASANLHPERGKLQEAMAFAHVERAPAGNPMMGIGLNWFSRHALADTIVWHNGGTGGYRTFIGFVQKKNMAVVVMTNSGGDGADDIGMHLLVPAIPLAPKPVPPKVRTAIELSADVMGRYAGVYQLAPQFSLDITMRDGALYMHPTDQATLRLWPETKTDFFLKEIDAQITFVPDAQGNAVSLMLHQNGQNLPAKKTAP
jgi:CubicO group peptidase (beta-lactamase class C family)